MAREHTGHCKVDVLLEGRLNDLDIIGLSDLRAEKVGCERVPKFGLG